MEASDFDDWRVSVLPLVSVVVASIGTCSYGEAVGP